MKKDLNRAESYQRLKARVLLEIELGKLPDAIKTIRKGSSSIKDKELSETLLIICYDYHKLRIEVVKGLLHKEEDAIQQRRIIHRIMELFNSYDEIQCILQEIENKQAVGSLRIDSS